MDGMRWTEKWVDGWMAGWMEAVWLVYFTFTFILTLPCLACSVYIAKSWVGKGVELSLLHPSIYPSIHSFILPSSPLLDLLDQSIN